MSVDAQPTASGRWDLARNSPAWGWAGVVSALLVLPLLQGAARLDTKFVVRSDNGRSVTVHAHGGLFLLYGLLALAPALLAAVVGRGLRWLNLSAVAVIALIAAGCEAFVSYTTWPTF